MLDTVNGNKCRRLKTEDLGGHHIVPAFWSPQNDPAPFPFPETYRWKSLEQICVSLGIKRSIVCATPQIWQIEPLVYRTTRDIGVPVILTPPQNLPLLKPFCEQAGVDIVITAPESLSTIVDILKDVAERPKAIIVINKDTSTWPHDNSKFESILILNELHLTPGLPLLFKEIEQAATTDFKRNDLFLWTDGEDGTPRASLPDTWPVKIVDVPLPFRLATRSASGLFSIS